MNQFVTIVRLISFAISPCLFLVGCGGGNLETAAVKGKVTKGGQPVTDGLVMFYPVAMEGKNTGKPASGELNSSGEYVLGTFNSSDGAVPGEHRITVLSTGKGDRQNLGSATPATVTVNPGESNEINIELTEFVVPKGKRPNPTEEDDDEDDD